VSTVASSLEKEVLGENNVPSIGFYAFAYVPLIFAVCPMAAALLSLSVLDSFLPSKGVQD